MLPRPHANDVEYRRILENRLRRFPKCRENWEKYQAGRSHYSETVDWLPVKMDYEVSAVCNFRCTMCLMSEIYDHKRPMMTYDQFRQSFDAQPGLVEVKLQGVGEPLLNKDFFKMAELCVENDVWARTTTNGSLLHLDENYKRIVDCGLGEIQVSVDGATAETYEKIRRGGQFVHVVENVTKMNTYAHEKGEAWRTSCWMLVQRENRHEVESMVDLAAKMKFTRLVYSIAISSWGKDNWEEINADKEVKEGFTEELAQKLIERGKELGVEVTFWDGKDKYEYTENHDKLCAWLWSRAYISGGMDIVPCCVICDSDTCKLGEDKDFPKDWNGAAYRKMRRLHMLGEIPKICRNCYM